MLRCVCGDRVTLAGVFVVRTVCGHHRRVIVTVVLLVALHGLPFRRIACRCQVRALGVDVAGHGRIGG